MTLKILYEVLMRLQDVSRLQRQLSTNEDLPTYNSQKKSVGPPRLARMIAAYKTFCRFEKYRTGEGGCWQVRCRPPFSSAYQKLTQHNEVSISIDKCLKQNSLSSQCIAHQKDIYSSTWRVLSFKIFNLLKTLLFFKICYSLKFLFFKKGVFQSVQRSLKSH